MKALICPGINLENTEIVKMTCDALISFGIIPCMKDSESKNNYNAEYGDFHFLLDECDVVIPVGGDGTIIHYAKHAALKNKPVLGINAGRLGYMAALEKSELSLLSRLNLEDCDIRNRMMLNVKASRAGAETFEINAFNDVVISKGMSAHTVDLDIYCDKNIVNSIRSDGLIISTPTGSTAYTLSAGGPIVDPELSSILVTPICPHSFFSRTLIFSDTKTITVSVKSHETYLSADGEENIYLSAGSLVNIKKSVYSANLINLRQVPFYEIVNRKFGVK